MSRLTPTDEIRKRLRSFDRGHMDQLHKLSRYLVGDGGALNGGVKGVEEGDDGLPIYSDISLYVRKIGKSRRILNNALLSLSRSVSTEPAPRFPAVDDFTAELRRQFFLARYRGRGYGDGHWSRLAEQAFLDGEQLGYGALVFGARRNPKTGEQYVDAAYVPAVQCLWDPLESTIGRSTWFAAVQYVQPEKAIAMFGEEKVRPHIRTTWDSHNKVATRFVRITEYWDTSFSHGYASDRPTYAVFVGPWSGKPAVRTENPYGCLPVAFMEYVTPPGMGRPIGKIELQININEGINELEEKLRRIVKKFGVDYIDVKQVDKEDLAKLTSGRHVPYVRIVAPDPNKQPVVQRVPAEEVQATLFQLLQLYERQHNSDSQSNELERGNILSSQRTATETQLLASSSQQSGVYTRRMVQAFYRRLVAVALKVAAAIDRDPVEIDVFGRNIVLNDPTDPRLSIDGILEEPSPVVIDAQALEAPDVVREQQLEHQRLMMMAPYVGVPGAVLMRPFLERLVKAAGVADPAEFLGDEGEGLPPIANVASSMSQLDAPQGLGATQAPMAPA